MVVMVCVVSATCPVASFRRFTVGPWLGRNLNKIDVCAHQRNTKQKIQTKQHNQQVAIDVTYLSLPFLCRVCCVDLSVLVGARCLVIVSPDRLQKGSNVNNTNQHTTDTHIPNSPNHPPPVMWRLFTDRGAQVWKYAVGEKKEQLPEYRPELNPVRHEENRETGVKKRDRSGKQHKNTRC